MARRRVPSKPRRRVFKTGGTLPALTTDFRPIPLGLDEDGNDDGQIRAFAVNVRNLSDSPIYIKEGNDSDEAIIDRFEHYTIWETNGINSLSLRGDTGSEVAELRVLEAHNDFSIKDKIEAFVRAISHFFAQSKTEAVITGSEVVFDTKITDATGVNFDTNISGVDGGVDIDTVLTDVADTVNVNTTLAASTATVDTNIASQTANLNTNIAAQDVDISTTLEAINTLEDLNVDINTQSVGNLNTDITAQSIGNLNVLDIEGTPVREFLTGSDEMDDELVWYPLGSQTAPLDGFVQMIYVRFYDAGTQTGSNNLDEMSVELRINFDNVLPRGVRSTKGIDKFGRNGRTADIQRYDENNECVFLIEPTIPFKFREGDSVEVAATYDAIFGSASTGDDYTAEIEVVYLERTT